MLVTQHVNLDATVSYNHIWILAFSVSSVYIFCNNYHEGGGGNASEQEQLLVFESKFFLQLRRGRKKGREGGRESGREG